MDEKAESEAKPKVKRLDLSIAQVAGSALAAVVAALLAGKLGVYGTVIGAGVVSVVATTGGTVFQHLFRRTGEQIRDVTAVQSPPKLRRVPVKRAGEAVERARSVSPEAHAGAYTGAHDRAHFHGFSEEYSPGTTHGTRLRGWKRPLLAAGAVFVLAMGTVTAVELASGSSADGDKGGTTVSRLFRQESQEHRHRDPAPSHSPGRGGAQGDEDAGGGESTPSPGVSPSGDGSGKQSPAPSGSPSGGGSSPSPNPTPDASPDAGKGDDKGGAQGTGGSAGPSAPPQGQNAAAGTS